MSYRYEDLGHEKFQRLCGALLAHLDHTVQLPPTGQADGGFDGYRRIPGEALKFTAFQVKFTEFPDRVSNPVNWLKTTLEDELDNIKRMAAEGTKDYLLITNLRGTAKPRTGRMDRMDNEAVRLTQTGGLRVWVWWRNDLDARLDSAPADLKFAYPDMLIGADAMRALLADTLEKGAIRRQGNMIRDAARAAWKTDQYVGFRQGRLEGVALEDLFVDVPARRRFEPTTATTPGAHKLLSSAAAPRRTMIFGAPGQGKSTLVQRLCQGHRTQFLSKDPSESADPGMARVVFKVILRDYAKWLSGRDPLSVTDKKRPSYATDSVESYASHLMSSDSGGRKCRPEDISDIGCRYPTLFAFDGLDEVGEPRLRERVVKEITAFDARSVLWDVAPQLVVTSRPSYDQLPEPSNDIFINHVLEPLSEALRLDYLRKWAASQSLTQTDRDEVERVFRERSGDEHVRELATNPMQLTILLFLIHHRGDSVPQRRTRLYEDYLSAFLDREASKWPLLKARRPDVEAITAFLGWHLQSLAERDGDNGRESRDQLIRATKIFLVDNDRVDAIATVEDLFTTVTERVWALTSRVTGTFEFDVQSIREYFAALFLYERAPAGGSGATIFERFQQLASRPYWLNVTRFMAGMFRYGEKAQLADDLVQAIVGASDMFWPRQVALTMLKDGVFDDQPAARGRVVAAAFDDLGVRLAVDDIERGMIEPLAMSRGGQELCERLRTAIAATPEDPLAIPRMSLLTLHEPAHELLPWWLQAVRSQPQSRDRWLELGSIFAVGARLSEDDLRLFEPWTADRAAVAVRAGAAAPIGSELADLMLRSVLDGRGPFDNAPVRSVPSAIAALVNVRDLAKQSGPSTDRGALAALRKANRPLADAMQEARRRKAGQAGTTSTFADIADEMQRQFGRCWLGNLVAIAGASATQLRTGHSAQRHDTAFGAQATPSGLLREVRARKDDIGWWCAAPHGFDDDLDWSTWMVALLTCASPPSISAAIDEHATKFAEIDAWRLDAVWRAVVALAPNLRGRRIPSALITDALAVSSEVAALIAATAQQTTDEDVAAYFRIDVAAMRSRIGKDFVARERWIGLGNADRLTEPVIDSLVNASIDTDYPSLKAWQMPSRLSDAAHLNSPWELLHWRDRRAQDEEAVDPLTSIADKEQWALPAR